MGNADVTQMSVGGNSFMTVGSGGSITGMRGRPGMNINGKVYDFKTTDRIDIRGGRVYVNGTEYVDGPKQTFTKTGVPDSRAFRCGNLTLKTGEVESWKLTGTLRGDEKVEDVDWKDSDYDLELVLNGGSFNVNFSGDCVVEGAFDTIAAKTISGNLLFTGKAESLRTNAVNGDTRIMKSRIGTFMAQTVNGDVKVRDSTIKNDSTIQTVNGDVDLFLKHPAVVTSTIPSSFIKKCEEGPKITITTVNGDVEFDCKVRAAKRTREESGSAAKRVKRD